MNLILLFSEDFVGRGPLVRLQGRRCRHVREVHRAAVGDRLCVGMAGGRIGTALVTRIGETALEMEVHFDREPPAPLPLTLVLALPRPKVLRRVLVSAASMGVKSIVLLNTWRVEKSYWQSPVLAPEAIREQLVLGLEQARDTLLPEVLLRPRFKPFVEDELPALTEGALALVGHPGSAEPCPRQLDGPACLAIGPEGGFIPYEIDKLCEGGFQPVHLGERILRVEAAVPALLGRLF